MKTTGDRYFRDPRQPNLRQQDGAKLPMLCADCEQILSAVETPFASEVFEPLMANPGASVSYGPFALQFMVSLLWRNLAIDFDSRQSPAHFRDRLQAVELEWRCHLLSQSPLDKLGRIHLFVTDFLKHGGPEYNLYLTRDADATTMWSDSRGLIAYCAKFAKLIVVAELASFEPHLWVNTLVDFAGGKVMSSTLQIRDVRFGHFLVARVRMFEGYREQGTAGMSPNQREKVRARVENHLERLVRTELGRAMAIDWLQDTGTQAERDEPCPCGSGRKHKRRHGA
jgi:hypothetical protein